MKEYTLRKLKSTDIMPFVKILKNIGVKEFSALYGKYNDLDEQEAQAAAMMDILGIVLDNLEKCESDIFKFVSSVSGLKLKEVEELSPADFMEIIVEIKNSEGFNDFFKVASKLFS